METEPKNFRGNFPLDGERIGPAWRSTWAALDGRRWTQVSDLEPVAVRCGVTLKTLQGLLQQARQAGQVEVRYVKAKTGGRRSEYRGKKTC